MQTPTKKCQEILKFLFVMLRGNDSRDDLEFTWEKAIEMMSKSKKMIEECQNYDLQSNLQQWKIDMLQPEIDQFNLDEQIMVTYSKALSLICTWIFSIVESHKALNNFKRQSLILEVM